MFLVPIFLSGLCDRERMCTANNHHATFLSGLCDRELSTTKLPKRLEFLSGLCDRERQINITEKSSAFLSGLCDREHGRESHCGRLLGCRAGSNGTGVVRGAPAYAFYCWWRWRRYRIRARRRSITNLCHDQGRRYGSRFHLIRPAIH